METLLAGDVGGTKTLLGLFNPATFPPAPIEVCRFTTRDFEGLTTLVERFLGTRRDPISAACFGVAGPVRDNRAQLTNVPWRITTAEIAGRFGIPRVRLLNDVAAMACALPALTRSQVEVLQPGDRSVRGNLALIAPGTGLGEALLCNVDGRFVPVESEGGHADFAARTPREHAFVETLATEFGRVSYERVLSGPGLVNVHRFVHQTTPCRGVPDGASPATLPALITRAGLGGDCAGCAEALKMFVSALGAEAGNLGLRSSATAGVYVGGGIPPKILPALRTPDFLAAFNAKAPMQPLVESMPVMVILEPDAALLGAAVSAQEATQRPATRPL